jgi:hypothetical protein
MGIGIATGMGVVENLGSPEHLESTAMRRCTLPVVA